MPTPKNKYDREQMRRIDAIQRQIDAIYDEAVREAAALGVTINMPQDAEKMFSFDDYPMTKKRVKEMLDNLRSQLQAAIVNGVRSSWTLANNKNNELCNVVFGNNVGKLTEEQYRRYYSTNGAALDAFIKRKENGMNLSDRVWHYSDLFKREIEMGLDLGIRSGLDAPAMARDLKQYLRHPDKLFRRVRDEHGNLQLSKAAADFHPGRGVYRSSYLNARRLAATETNIAYRTADHERWKQMDFVVGIEIHLSNNHTCKGRDGKPHPFTDICDDLKGKYPKDFKFTGWHPHCRCFATSILKTDEEIAEDTKRILRGERPTEGSENTVEDVPDGFKQWVEDNQERIGKAKQRGTLPYFLRDNGTASKEGQYTLDIRKPEVNRPEVSDAEKLQVELEVKEPRITPKLVDKAVEEKVESINVQKVYGTEYDEDESLAVDFFGKNILDWDKAKTRMISTRELYSVQDKVFPEILQRYIQNPSDEAIAVIEVGNRRFVYDGNHRAAAAIITGKEKIKASVIRLKKSEFEQLFNLSKTDPDRFGDILSGVTEFEPIASAKTKAEIPVPKKINANEYSTESVFCGRFDDSSDNAFHDEQLARSYIFEREQELGVYDIWESNVYKTIADTSKLVATQPQLEINTLNMYLRDIQAVMRSENVPVGYRLENDGLIYLIDGHHRAAAAILSGNSQMPMVVVDIPKEIVRKMYLGVDRKLKK